jgi:hypothetical protein
MKSNFTQAEAIPGLMGGTANKDSERYKRRGGLHTPNAYWMVSENHDGAPASVR